MACPARSTTESPEMENLADGTTRRHYRALGLDDNGYEILGITLPYIEMPVGPGRNLSVLIEVAARNHHLKLKGYHPARELARKLGERMKPPDDDAVSDSIGDREPGDGESR